jgi:tetrapyrrole methylase family protein/MazG family protein
MHDTKRADITLLGLGPGSPDLLTRKAWRALENAPEIYLRTRHHPVVEGFPREWRLNSFDYLYESHDDFDEVYAGIIDRVLALGRREEGVLYAVPGHPFVAEATGPEIARRARQEGLSVQIIDGLSFIEPILSRLGIDPFPHTALVDAIELSIDHVPPYPPSVGAIIAQIHSKLIASELKLTLMSLYPDHHSVKLVHGAGTQEEIVEDLALYEIDRSPHIGLLTALYVPPLGPATSFEAFQEIIAHLRAPDGCPWDREQTHQSLRPHLLEEAYEAISALDADDPQAMREEFGDLLLQIVLHAQIASEYGEFTMADVLQGIHHKIVHRHPHVFGGMELEDTESVLQNWERLKAAERAEKGQNEASSLDGVAVALPALIQAEEYQRRAGRVGFDWPKIEEVMDKVMEEIGEVKSAPNEEARADEIGDLLFAVVNLARWCHVDAESALRQANQRFRNRFTRVEAVARQEGRELTDYSLNELEAMWQDAKAEGE